MRIKKGDYVVVIAGKDKGKKGKVIETSPKTDKLVVENVNIVTKHKKPRSAQDKGGIIKQTNPIERSNVMLICPACDKATRVKHKEINGKKVRVCKCGASLDKEFVKAVKKEAKASTQEKKKVQEKQVKQTSEKPRNIEEKNVKTSGKVVEKTVTKQRKTVAASGK